MLYANIITSPIKGETFIYILGGVINGRGTDTENLVDNTLGSNVAYIKILFRADSTGTTVISTIDGILTVNSVEYTLTM